MYLRLIACGPDGRANVSLLAQTVVPAPFAAVAAAPIAAPVIEQQRACCGSARGSAALEGRADHQGQEGAGRLSLPSRDVRAGDRPGRHRNSGGQPGGGRDHQPSPQGHVGEVGQAWPLASSTSPSTAARSNSRASSTIRARPAASVPLRCRRLCFCLPDSS